MDYVGADGPNQVAWSGGRGLFPRPDLAGLEAFVVEGRNDSGCRGRGRWGAGRGGLAVDGSRRDAAVGACGIELGGPVVVEAACDLRGRDAIIIEEGRVARVDIVREDGRGEGGDAQALAADGDRLPAELWGPRWCCEGRVAAVDG